MRSGLVRTKWFYHDEDNEKWPMEDWVDPKDNKKWFRIGPIAPPYDRMKLVYAQQVNVWDHTLCWPVIRYRKGRHIMGRVNVHDKMHGMLWL